MKRSFGVVLFFFLIAVAAAQKQSHSGYLIFLLGNDTTMAGSFSINNKAFDVTVVARPAVSVTKLKGTLFDNGELQSAEGYAYRPVPGKDSQLIIRYRLFVKDDSTFITQQRGNDITVQRFAGRGLTANGIGAAFRYLLPFWGLFAPKQVGDSIVSGHLTLGGNRRLTLKRIAPDKLYGGSTVMGMMTLYLDKQGMVNYIDAIGSSWNVIGKASGPMNLEALANRYAQEEQSGKGMSLIARFDSVSADMGDARMKIYYSRPQVRGRTIFGTVVPWDRFWRTGANAATRMVITKPVYFGDKELPAGAYSIWTLPSLRGWTMMFNSQANVWGTEYNPAYDVLKVPMQVGSPAAFTEVMTIEIQPSDNGGTLNVIWENTKAALPFRIGK
ncbi:MAG TPA: DUF2911 domain-containing protein [Chitinophagaceae bacterium]|nr:DUF2911 domain-containing protein [Chitinophagaceae bacterium]